MIYLNYGTYSAGVLTWGTEQAFNEISFKQLTNTERIKGRDLRQEEYSNLLSSRIIYELVITADELAATAKYTWLRTFFKAHAWKFSLTPVSTVTPTPLLWSAVGTSVVIEDGDMPVEFLEGCKYLPEVKLKLIQKAAD